MGQNYRCSANLTKPPRANQREGYSRHTQTDPRVLALAGATKKNGEMFSVSDEMHAGTIIHAHAGRDENTQVNGYVFLVDWTGFTAKSMTRWNMDDMRKWNSCWQVGRLHAYTRPMAPQQTGVNTFSTRLLSICTDEYAHTYDISTY